MQGINHDAAKAAAVAAWELVASRPAAPEAARKKKLTGIVLRAIEQAQRRKAETRRLACIGCYRTIHFHARQAGRKVRCPICGTRQIAPEKVGRN